MKYILLVLCLINFSPLALSSGVVKYICPDEIVNFKKQQCNLHQLRGKKLEVFSKIHPDKVKCKQGVASAVVISGSCASALTPKTRLSKGARAYPQQAAILPGPSGDSGVPLEKVLNSREFSVTKPSREH